MRGACHAARNRKIQTFLGIAGLSIYCRYQLHHSVMRRLPMRFKLKYPAMRSRNLDLDFLMDQKGVVKKVAIQSIYYQLRLALIYSDVCVFATALHRLNAKVIVFAQYRQQRCLFLVLNPESAVKYWATKIVVF